MTFKEHVKTTLLGAGSLAAIIVLAIAMIAIRLILLLLYVPYWASFLPSLLLMSWLIGLGIRTIAKEILK